MKYSIIDIKSRTLRRITIAILILPVLFLGVFLVLIVDPVWKFLVIFFTESIRDTIDYGKGLIERALETWRQ